ncbi:MAG: hypothetical protein Q9M89_03865 [Persephonella sp.]|nr:hypothetical protein [Persephonella sp.]
MIYSAIGFLIISDVEKNKEARPETIKTKKEIPVKKVKPVESFDLKGSIIKGEISKKVSEIEIPELSYYQKKTDTKSRYNYYILKGKKAEIEGKYIDAISFLQKSMEYLKKRPIYPIQTCTATL